MIARIVAAFALIWALGFVWFGTFLPEPVGKVETDAIVVPTGSAGRIDRGLATLRAGYADKMLVSGVDPEVRPNEFAALYPSAARYMDCCITLGFAASDTRGNALEAGEWLAENEVKTVRLVTSDWHMARAAYELSFYLPDGVQMIEDAVPTNPRFETLFVEYNKLLASMAAHALDGLGIA